MWWLTAQIFFCLLLAAAVGMIVGWMLRRLLGDDATSSVTDEAFYGQKLDSSFDSQQGSGDSTLDPPGLLARDSSAAKESALSAEISKLQSTIDDLTEQNHLLQQQYSESSLSPSVDSSALTAANDRLDQQNQQIGQLETQLRNAFAENEILLAENRQSDKSSIAANATDAELTSLRDQFDTLRNDNDTKASELAHLQRQWEADQQQHRQAKAQIDDQLTQINSLVAERDQQDSDLNQLRQQMSGDSTEAAQLKLTIDELQQRYSQTQQERDTLHKQIGDLEEQTRALRVLAEDAEDTRELRQSISESRREIDALKNENGRLGDHLQSAQGELDGLRKEHESAQAEVHTLSERAALADSLPHTEQQLEETARSLAEITTERQRLVSQVARIEAERDEALIQCDEAQQKSKLLNEGQVQQDEETRKLKKDVSRLTNQTQQLDEALKRQQADAEKAILKAEEATAHSTDAASRVAQFEAENERLQRVHDDAQQKTESSAATETSLRNNLIEITKQRNAIQQQNDRLQGEVIALKANERGESNIGLQHGQAEEIARLKGKLKQAGEEVTRLKSAPVAQSHRTDNGAEVLLQQQLTESRRQTEAVKQRNEQLETDIKALNRRLIAQVDESQQTDTQDSGKPSSAQVALFRPTERSRPADDPNMAEIIEQRNRLQQDNEKLHSDLNQLRDDSRSTINQERELRASLTHTRHQRDDFERQLRQIRDQLQDERSIRSRHGVSRPAETARAAPAVVEDDISVTEQGTALQADPPPVTSPEPSRTPPPSATRARGKTITVSEADRPTAMAEPRFGSPDDLKEIKGIGPVIERKLQELGIFHFDQIASWSPQTGEWINQHLDFPGRVARERWVKQATRLAQTEE